jgi:hypothetical protein
MIVLSLDAKVDGSPICKSLFNRAFVIDEIFEKEHVVPPFNPLDKAQSTLKLRI